MATQNDFKILSQLSSNYFDTFVREDQNDAAISTLQALPPTQQSRLGFYILVLEQLTHLSDYTDIADHITDSEFNTVLYSDASDDFGVDAVVIDDENKQIKLFNFKYREKFKVSSQGVNETILSTKYLNALFNDDYSDMAGKPLAFAKEIKRKHMTNDVWRTVLYVVSNEDFKVGHLSGHLRQLRDSYDLTIEPIGLNEISDLISLRPSAVNAAMMLDPEAVMSFTENPLDSSKSYIFRLSLAELVRITSKDSELRMEYNLEDLSRLAATSLDSSVLFDNVRGFVLKSKFNANIAETIKISPTKFFMYNNGLTLIASDIVSQVTNSRNKVKVDLSNFQVLNGGQTLRTVHDFNNADGNNISDYLSKAEVLVRIFKTQNQFELNSKIAEYTNSQNTISNVDLKSLRKEQISLEQYLEGHDILYSRKTGDTGNKKNRSYRIQISMEKFGQILMTYGGQPEKAVNAKKSIFDKLYDSFFIDNPTLLEDSVEQIEKFYEVKNAYKSANNIESSDQKIFYIMYIIQNTRIEIDVAITLLERTLDSYQHKTEKDVARSRLMIHTAFKKLLDEAISKINVDKAELTAIEP